MKWQEAFLAACAVSTAILGWVTLRRGRKTDDVLDVAANIQSTFEAQKSTFEAQKDITSALREDVVRLRAAHQQCEEATNHLRRSLVEANLERDALAREHARTKATVDEHEQTIARHERTINQLKAARREL